MSLSAVADGFRPLCLQKLETFILRLVLIAIFNKNLKNKLRQVLVFSRDRPSNIFSKHYEDPKPLAILQVNNPVLLDI